MRRTSLPRVLSLLWVLCLGGAMIGPVAADETQRRGSPAFDLRGVPDQASADGRGGGTIVLAMR
jgi:hypothetical protein